MRPAGYTAVLGQKPESVHVSDDRRVVARAVLACVVRGCSDEEALVLNVDVFSHVNRIEYLGAIATLTRDRNKHALPNRVVSHAFFCQHILCVGIGAPLNLLRDGQAIKN